ncbi:MAG: hypothetical protein HZA53_18715 [Planctomycetes bacterium]|nr:hypothetical protein [Planctomycetota bacterium]
MLQHLAGTALCFALCLVLISGLRAPRTWILAAIGLVPAAGACVAFTTAAFDLAIEPLARYAHGLAALALGFAHAVVYSLTALPRERVWMRGLLMFSGLWGGALAALWLFSPSRSTWLDVALVVFALATLAAWAALPFLSRERGFTRHGELVVPSVRFACPRCGTRVDWGKGVAACTDCGLFLHIAWPAPEPIAAAPVPDARRVRFACPECGSRERWPTGLSTCSRCGLRLSLHWNVHPSGR